MQDVRDAFRALKASPVVTAVAVLSLALGIGANTAIFSILDSLVLRTLPVKAPQQLAVVGLNGEPGSFTNPLWEQMRRHGELVDGIAAWSTSRFNLAASGPSDLVDGLMTSGSFFDVLGTSPLLGPPSPWMMTVVAAGRQGRWRSSATTSGSGDSPVRRTLSAAR